MQGPIFTLMVNYGCEITTLQQIRTLTVFYVPFYAFAQEDESSKQCHCCMSQGTPRMHVLKLYKIIDKLCSNTEIMMEYFKD